MSKIVKINANEVVFSKENPRIHLELDSLIADIAENGQREPVTVYKKDSTYTVLRGERRVRACQSLDKMVKAVVVPEPKSLFQAVVDHDSKSLTSEAEIARAGRLLMSEKPALTEKQFSTVMRALLDKVSPMKGKQAEAYQKAVKDGAKMADAYHTAKRGIIQYFYALATMPEKYLDAITARERGQDYKIHDAILTHASIKKLARDIKKMEDNDNFSEQTVREAEAAIVGKASKAQKKESKARVITYKLISEVYAECKNTKVAEVLEAIIQDDLKRLEDLCK